MKNTLETAQSLDPKKQKAIERLAITYWVFNFSMERKLNAMKILRFAN